MKGFIGGGNMAEALIKGIRSHSEEEILVAEPDKERRLYLTSTYKVGTTPDNARVASSCKMIVLAVKPQVMATVLAGIQPSLSPHTTVVSIAAGITLSYLSSALKTKKIVRVMPNTPALVLEAMSVLAVAEDFDGNSEEVAQVFSSIGKVVFLPEIHFDAVTALSGSGPAFIARFMGCLIDGAIDAGLPGDLAHTLAVQTLTGTAKLMAQGQSPAQVVKMVASPGGTTEAGLSVMEAAGMEGILRKTIQAAAFRSAELGLKG